MFQKEMMLGQWRSPKPDAVRSDPTLPERCEVVVIGAGIAGASTAYAFSRNGVPTVLCEKGAVADEQSSRNWGWVRKMHRDPRELPLMMESMRIWEGLNEALQMETGFRRSGIAYLCETQEDVARYERWLEEVRGFQLDSKVITRAEIEEVLPGYRGNCPTAFYTASDARAEPQKAAPALARGAQDNGATVVTNCAVRGLDMEGGRVAGVVTERGRVSCRAVVIAAGAWSGLLCRSLGVRFPQLKVVASVFRTEALDGGPETAVWGGGFAFRKRLDGGYSVANGNWNDVDIVPDSIRFMKEFIPAFKNERGKLRLRLGRRFFQEARRQGSWNLDQASPFERVRALDPEPSRKAMTTAYAALSAAFPVFENRSIEQCWAGTIDATPDALPVISEIESVPGLFLISGFSGHGFGIGPGAGFLMSDLVRGTAPRVDPTPFRFARFSDGTMLEPMARSV